MVRGASVLAAIYFLENLGLRRSTGAADMICSVVAGIDIGNLMLHRARALLAA